MEKNAASKVEKGIEEICYTKIILSMQRSSIIELEELKEVPEHNQRIYNDRIISVLLCIKRQG